MQPDLIIRGGNVFDGSGSAPQKADIAIRDGKVVEIGHIEATAECELDARDAYVTPGFIDIHSHSDYTLLIDPRAMSAIFQGVTCEVIGNCGFGCFPIANRALSAGSIYGFNDSIGLDWDTASGYLEKLEQAGPAVNVLTLTPNAQLRLATTGLNDSPASADDLRRMVYLLDKSMEEGSWGYSTGLEYAVEAGASSEEIDELCRCVVRHGGYYATHTRDRDGGAVAAVQEALGTAERTGVRLQISHLLPRSGEDAGRQCIDLVNSAHAGGMDVAYDMHTRLYGLTYLSAALPAWARTGKAEEIAQRLSSAGERSRMRDYRSILSAGNDWERVIILDNQYLPSYARRTISDIARERNQDPFDTVCGILSEVSHDLSSIMVLIAAYSPAQQHEVFAQPLCVPASDATTLAVNGPLQGSAFHGAYSWASWFYRTMVNEQKILSPQEAIYKLTGQPAERMGLVGRGRLDVGAWADVAIFSPQEFGERATTYEPSQLATGMRHVLVNGIVTLQDGQLTGERAGSVLRFSDRR